jgi:hypothetical protein
MGIEVTHADDADLERWNSYAERSPHGTAFHRLEALETLAEHSGTELHTLIGKKGQETVGIFPVFEKTTAGVTTVFSPPPRLLVTYLGPALLNFGKMKRRKAEKQHGRFVDGALEWMDEELDPHYTHITTPVGYEDLRPYRWAGFEATPGYTYRVDLLDDHDEMLSEFSSDARRNVTNTDADAYEIVTYEGDVDAVKRIRNRVEDRYDEQDKEYLLDEDFVVDLARRMPEHVRPVEIYADDEFAGGMITLDDGDTVYRWQGSVRFDVDVPANDLLDWHIMTDAVERGRTQYDMVGANTKRLNEYKSKFGPRLVAYHNLERGGPVMKAGAALYKRFSAGK